MTNMMLFFSIILNIITIFAVIILYLRQNRITALDHTQKHAMKEMEDLFSAYIEELKEENNQFIDNIKHLQENQSQKEKTEVNEVNESFNIENSEEQQKIDNQVITPHSYKHMTAVKSYQNKVEPSSIVTNLEAKETEPKTIQERVVSLKKEGLTNEEIAKKLNKGITEIELMLKFYKKAIDNLD
ncbi:hypothetical protein MHI39_15940 [Heyndrickxia sp. FSL K6-6286]|uniref:hypothetical protein n=1 Tax=Heyndrickxia TaxID=2837504 RepID=UPI0007172367|nr:hypothetical protein [Heyndrickxia oleronia]